MRLLSVWYRHGLTWLYASNAALRYELFFLEEKNREKYGAHTSDTKKPPNPHGRIVISIAFTFFGLFSNIISF